MVTAEEQMIAHLRKNCRISIASLARLLDISHAKAFYTLRLLQERCVIDKLTSIIDFKSLGYNMRSTVCVYAKDHPKMERYLSRQRCINSISRLKGGGFLIDAVFPDLAGLYRFLEELERFEPTYLQEYQLIEPIAQEKFMAIPFSGKIRTFS